MPLTLEDVVAPRPGIVCRMHAEGESVCLNVGTPSILHTPNFAIRDISGDLEGEEKIVFAERLMQQGILVRKIRAPS